MIFIRRTLQEHALKENQVTWNGFNELTENITKDLGTLIDGLVADADKYAAGTKEQKIIDFYRLARDMQTRDAAGTAPLKVYTDKIDAAETVDDFVRVLGEIGKAGEGSALVFGIMADITDSNKYVLANQGPSYILPKDYMVGDAYKPVQDALLAFIRKMFVLAGESEEKAAEHAGQVFQLEQELSAGGLSTEDYYDAAKYWHPYTKEELKALYSNCDIEGYLKDIGITQFDRCIVFEEENVRKINSYLTPEHLDLMKNYTKFVLYTKYSPYLTSAHIQAVNEINSMITGPTEAKDADTLAKEMTQSLFTWEFGRLYVEKYFSEDSKKEIEAMTRQIIATFRSRIQKLDWLSEATKQKAVQKLDAMKVKIGYPDEWPSYYDSVSIDTSKSLIDNLISIQTVSNANAQEILNSGVDKSAWMIPPQTVNATYNPQTNDITFPAAILQAPFYDRDASFAQNLGGIGTVIGHEITHAFDTSGAMYDENGNYSNWWTESDLAEFTMRAEKVKTYYNGIEVANGIFQNGDTTITENIADMGAMACALEIAGDDKKAQLEIFMSNANIWASNQTDQYRDTLLIMDTHSLDKVRVNAILPLFDQFYDVFGVDEDDAMYVAPEDRIRIW